MLSFYLHYTEDKIKYRIIDSASIDNCLTMKCLIITTLASCLLASVSGQDIIHVMTV